jgi:hypothetical protein
MWRLFCRILLNRGRVNFQLTYKIACWWPKFKLDEVECQNQSLIMLWHKYDQYGRPVLVLEPRQTSFKICHSLCTKIISVEGAHIFERTSRQLKTLGYRNWHETSSTNKGRHSKKFSRPATWLLGLVHLWCKKNWFIICYFSFFFIFARLISPVFIRCFM